MKITYEGGNAFAGENRKLHKLIITHIDTLMQLILFIHMHNHKN